MISFRQSNDHLLGLVESGRAAEMTWNAIEGTWAKREAEYIEAALASGDDFDRAMVLAWRKVKSELMARIQSGLSAQQKLSKR
jgi:hypothetical protein